MKEANTGQADKPKPKSVVVSSASGTAPGLKSSATNQAKSGMILVSASSPLVDTVPPPLDERNTPMWLPMQDETLTVQEIELDGKAYQVLKNTTSKEPEPELLPDKEQLERNQSMEVLLARLNSQLLESSQDAINAKRRARSKDKAPPVNAQGKAAPSAFQGSRTQPRENSSKNSQRATEPKSKSQSQPGKPTGNNSKSDKSVAQQKKDNQKFSTATSNSGSNKSKSAKSNPGKQ